MATATFNTGVTDASGFTTLSPQTTSTSKVESSNGVDVWNGVYRSSPVGVTEGNQYSFRSVIKIPIDFTTLTGAIQITGATLQLRYFNVSDTLDQVHNSGARTVNMHRLLVSFTESPGSDPGTGLGWNTSTSQNWDTKLKTAGTHYDSTVVASKALSGTVANKTLHEYDILPFIKKIAPTSLLVGATTGEAGEGLTNNGILLKMSATNAAQGAEYYTKEGAATYSTTVPTIVLTYTNNTAPSKPTPTFPLSLEIPTGDNVVFTANYSDPESNPPSEVTLEVHKKTTFDELLHTVTLSTTADPLSVSVPINIFETGTKYYWRVKVKDSLGAESVWSDATNASFTAPTITSNFPPPVDGNPAFAVTKTNARNKYRLEFYNPNDTFTAFKPTPDVVIFDAKSIGIGHQVNGIGESFFTLGADHPQVSLIQPQRTLWRACRWDSRAGYFRVIGEGLITNSMSSAHEIVFYGIDKLGMLNRNVASLEFVGEANSHLDVTLGDLHDSIMARGTPSASVTAIRTYPKATITGVSKNSPASITGMTFPIAGTVRFTAANTFFVGEKVTMSGIVPVGYNLADQTITGVDAAWFEIANTTTTAWTSGGAATSETLKYAAVNEFTPEEIITITGIVPTAYNLADVPVLVATSTYFAVLDSGATGVYASGGLATPDKYGTIRYTADNSFTGGQVVSIDGITPSNFNLPLVTITDRENAWFEVSSEELGAWVSGGTATLAKHITDLGWEGGTDIFADYSISGDTKPTAIATKSVQVAGQQAIDALAGFCDIVMGGTTNKAIVENPNIGLPAARIDTMNVGLRHRHIELADVNKPTWWLQYGVNVKRFKVEDNKRAMASRASIINRSFSTGGGSQFFNGKTDPDLYQQYGLLDVVEIVNDERNDIDFTAQLQYNLHPDRLFSVEMDVVPNSVSPFNGYAVGDDITLYIVDDSLSIKKDLTIVAQQWIGNANGTEYLAFAFSQKMDKSFIIATPEADTTGTDSPASATMQSTSAAQQFSFTKERA